MQICMPSCLLGSKCILHLHVSVDSRVWVPDDEHGLLGQRGFVLMAPGSVYLWLLCGGGEEGGLCHKTTSVSVSPRVFSQVPGICPRVHVCVCESFCGPMYV